MRLKLDLHEIYNKSKDLDRALHDLMDEAEETGAKKVEIIPGKGSGALKKRVLRFLDRKDIKAWRRARTRVSNQSMVGIDTPTRSLARRYTVLSKDVLCATNGRLLAIVKMRCSDSCHEIPERFTSAGVMPWMSMNRGSKSFNPVGGLTSQLVDLTIWPFKTFAIPTWQTDD